MTESHPSHGPRFRLGRLVATPGALAALRHAESHPIALLVCHMRGDWQEVGDFAPKDVSPKRVPIAGNFIHQLALILRKLTITLALLTIATVSHAGVDICSMKRSQYERAQCYEYAVSGGLLRMKKNYERIMAAPNVPKALKENIPKNHKEWTDYVEKKCSDNACYYSHIRDRNQDVEQFMAKYGINPI
ncbi:hypothetical protein [Cupriavidus oxalaticus]|uniref:Uncharacterized protein n=1 Tax=Cupriavidus oxalaticus TaxID=96344 RepID=A0A4P7LFS4_9BURK|nr:hypothetical protein [Cupriavidus oxalaticus]QBY54458.1 hypothetical protein E0W60_26045 [Cupriavidus oxalaticus]